MLSILSKIVVAVVVVVVVADADDVDVDKVTGCAFGNPDMCDSGVSAVRRAIFQCLLPCVHVHVV